MAESRRTCATCGASNEEDARFCEGCGTSLARICATCGVEATATARFCRGCGAALDGEATQPRMPVAGPVRKTVTVMFADLAGSTTFEERVDAETAREVIGRYHELLRTIAERHRAGVTKYIGDGFMAVWGVPEIGPDDAIHAVDAAVDLQERFVGFAGQVAEVDLALRVSVNTGEVVVGAGDADLVGDALNVGARLESECPKGHVVVGEETWRATRGRYGYESLGDVQVKGRTAPVAVYQWVARQSETTDAAPFVGRGNEVRRLQAAMDSAIATRAARLATVIGDPGVGKSRLAAEFAQAQSDALVVDARCVLDATVALGPLVEVLRASDLESDVPAGTPERDRLLRDLNGLAEGVPGSVEENFWALRRYIEMLATSAPVVLVLDDIQWADTLLLDFIEHLVEWVKDVPVFVLALARPELRDIRPELVTVSRWASEAVHLGGLDADATAELAAKVLGAARLPDELLTRLPSSTGGNPLFVRELIGMLAHDGVLVEETQGWRLTIDVDAISIPPTIHALLASRLERLDAVDRRVLEIASVVGSDFSIGMVRALADARAAEGIKLSLNRLRRLELAQPSGAYVGDEAVWRFHHVLIRDVAYRRLLKSDRADLHERLADWVATGGQSVAFDADEMIARHLEAAHIYKTELGIADEHTGDLALRSARHYATSARRALDRDELVSAGTQAARGAAVAAGDEGLHAELLLIGCEAYLSAGDVAAGAPLVDDLDRIADESLAPWATCYRCQFLVYTEPERLPEVDTRLQGAIDEFGRRKDAAGLAKAHRVRASARSRLGRIGDCEADLFEALIAARQSGDHRQITAALGAAPGAALWGPSPVPKAGGRCLDVVRMQRMTTAAPSLEATSLRHLAVLELLRGRPDKARKMLADARTVVADLGLRHGLMETELFAGIIESMEGDAVAAEPHFRTALDGFRALGVGADAGQAAALLARMVLAQGRIDEADRYAAESERLAGRNLKTAIAWRAVRAEILAAQGQHEEAVAMAQDAVAVAAGTDLVLDHADACLALYRVLAAAEDTNGASSARSNAEALYTAKEVTARIGRVAAPSVPSSPVSTELKRTRLAITNQASETVDAAWLAFQAHNIADALADFSDRIVYDDHRRFSGMPIKDIGELRVATERAREQFQYSEWITLAVRGERLELRSIRMWDDAGNEATTLNVFEISDRRQVEFWGRFDEDDFDTAYRELERRYYVGEGMAFAESGSATTEAIVAVNNNDFDRLFGELSSVDLNVENRSSSGFPDRSASDLRASFGELNAMVSMLRTWLSAMHWVSPHWCVSRLDRDGLGEAGERYTWMRLLVIEVRDGRLASMCMFELDDEAAAFAYVEERTRTTTSRLDLTNQATRTVARFWAAMSNHDVDAAIQCCSEGIIYDDYRSVSGDPVNDLGALRAALSRIVEQYTDFESRVLAVRGEHLLLGSSRWSNDAGFETSYLHVIETAEHGQVVHETRFDEEDFECACRELDRRYFAGEGAAFAENGLPSSEAPRAMDRNDFDLLFGELCSPDLVVESRSSRAFPHRSADELRRGFEELNTFVVSKRTWNPAVAWLSPTVSVIRLEREAIGHDGGTYEWAMLLVAEHADGRLISLCEFDPDDEDAAFAYAEERIRAADSRLAVTNCSVESSDRLGAAMNAHDIDAIMGCFSDQLVYDDRRRLTGDPISGRAEFKAAFERILDQYSQFERRIVAVRGDRLNLHWGRWSDDSGNETSYLHVYEMDDDGRQVYEGRFDEDNFEDAYRELDTRYAAGEGAAYAKSIMASLEWTSALNRGEFDRMLSELSTSDVHAESRARFPFPRRSAAELSASLHELASMVSSTRTWNSAVHWLSPNCNVVRMERESLGSDNEQYKWSRLYVIEFRDGLLASLCEFELDDEDAAFTYAKERLRASNSLLAVANRSCASVQQLARTMQAQDIDALFKVAADDYLFIDNRRLSGDPIRGRAELEAGLSRLFGQYNHFEFRPLAVRGELLSLHKSSWSDDAGNVSAFLHVFEVDDNGRAVYEARYDEGDFEGAYRELDRRYYAGEGEVFAEAGTTVTDYLMAYNHGDFDEFLGYLTNPEMRFENRSRSVFPDRSVAEFRASIEELSEMVDSSLAWYSAIVWISESCCVSRFERLSIGEDGEQYSWTRIYVSEFRDGRATLSCQFDADEEEAAFAYADERMRVSARRLAVTNRSCDVVHAVVGAASDHNVDATVAHYSDQFEYGDHRRLTGYPVRGISELRAAFERIFEQYTHSEWRTLAVRGNNLSLHWSRWEDDFGNQTSYLHVFEIGEDGRIIYEGRFDEDDFVGAYRDLGERYYCGEGAPFADGGRVTTEFAVALSQGDVGRIRDGLIANDFRLENRSRSAFADRSAAELLATVDELHSMVASVRECESAVWWLTPTIGVGRTERVATGASGERYTWTHIHVNEISNGRLKSACLFELDDEDAAFAYAEERAQVKSASRLRVTNRASQTTDDVAAALNAGDVERTVNCFAQDFVYDDRRRLSGDPIEDATQLRAACRRILAQYNRFDDRILAVRGERLALGMSRWSNDSGYETTQLAVNEVGGDGRIRCQIRFDEDDFDGAFRELERRYYASEGAAFAEPGALATEYSAALNQQDFDRFFGELSTPDMRLENRSRSVFPDRSIAEFRASLEDLHSRVSSMRTWNAAHAWVSPDWGIIRQEREAVGLDGERFSWTRIYVAEIRNGRIAALIQFEPSDEAAAFAYAQERAQVAASRLAVANRATATVDAAFTALQNRDVDGTMAGYSERLEYDDRRQLSGNPITDIAVYRAAIARAVDQYDLFEWRILAVRGDRLALLSTRMSSEAGFESEHLHLFEVNEADLIVYEGRFDRDDFEGAYAEFERRYYAGEGAEFAEAGLLADKLTIAMDRGDFDRILSEIADPAFRLENRSRSIFPDRSASEMTAGFEEVLNMVESTRTWNSALCWLRPSVLVGNFEREATGADGERYEWSGINVAVFRDGKIASVCLFDADDEAAAFVYAEEQARDT